MPLYAGLDWSGTPIRDDRRYLYVACLVAIPPTDDPESRFAPLRAACGLPVGKELRGHELGESRQAAILAGLEEMDARVVGIVYDKHIAQDAWPDPKSLAAKTGLAVVAKAITMFPLAYVWYDRGDINEENRQRAFATAVQRANRKMWPDNVLKIRPRPSHRSDLIQAADVVSYTLSRLARGLIGAAALREQVEKIWNDPRNRVIGPTVWIEEEDDLWP